MKYPIATYGTIGVIAAAFLLHAIVSSWIAKHNSNNIESYRRRKLATTLIGVAAVVAVAIFWSRLLSHKGTFFGLLGAGLAVALREPLLSIAGRISIFAGHMYNVGDRIEINKMAGDVIDIGFFYTRLMEIGNWVKGDQVTGRITQFSNSIVFGNPVYNYTQNFSYIWDEVALPITYASNIDAATRILLDVAGQYTEEFLQTAQHELEKMRHSFLVPTFELKPAVYLTVTDNYIELAMRYVVDPKKRRIAKSFIYSRVFQQLQSRAQKDIHIGSTTMDLTVHEADDQKAA